MSGSFSRPVGSAAVKEAIAIIRARALVVLIVATIGAIGGVAFGVARQEGGTRVAIRLGLYPLSENQATIDLGVSTPVGPLAADFSSDEVLAEVASRSHVSLDALRDRLRVQGVPLDPHQMILQASGEDEGNAMALLRDWLAAIQAQRREFIVRRIDAARRGLLHELHRARLPLDRREALDNLTTLAALAGSLRTDVVVLRRPYRVDSAIRSPVFYGLIGVLLGVIAGAAVALGIGVLDRRLRTPTAIAARFGFPVIADLGTDQGVHELRRRVELAGASKDGGSLVVVEAGDGKAADRVARGLGDRLGCPVVAAGAVGDVETLTQLRDATVWVIAVTPGATRADQVDRAVRELSSVTSPPLGLVLD
jgi:hypothetical protein